MIPEQYKRDPCGASSLSYWKTNAVSMPPSVSVVRDDQFVGMDESCVETLYFKMVHRLNALSPVSVPDGFSFASVDEHSLTAHISHCYEDEYVSAEELIEYKKRDVYSPDLWIALKESDSGAIAASGIAEFDRKIKEGALEWIQVSPEYRCKRLGRFLVNELLLRLKGKADFVTVSGRMDNPSDPYALYLSCGFEAPVFWHVIRKRQPQE